MKPGKSHTEVVGITGLAAHLGVTRETVGKFVESGVFERRPDGDFDQTACRLRLVRHLMNRKQVTGGRSRERYEAARAEREQMKAAQLAGTLCKTSDFGEAIDDVFGFLIPRLDSLPSRITRDLALRRQWNEEIRQLRTEVSAYCKKRADELGGGEAAA